MYVLENRKNNIWNLTWKYSQFIFMDLECNKTTQSRSKISTLNGRCTTRPNLSLCFYSPIDRKIKMTAQPLIGRDIFVNLRRRHKHPLLGYISVCPILTFHIYEFSETACTQIPLTASYFSSQSLSACVSIWNRKASTQNPIPSFSSQSLSACSTIQSYVLRTMIVAIWASFHRYGTQIIPYGCWFVDCCLTSHSAIFQLYSNGKIVQFSKIRPAARHPTPWAARGL